MAIREQTEKISIEFTSEMDNGTFFNIRYYFNDTINKYVADIVSSDGTIVCASIPFEALCDTVDYVRSKSSSKNILSSNKIVAIGGKSTSLPIPSVAPANNAPHPAPNMSPKTDLTKEPIQLSSLGKKEKLIKEAESIEVSSEEDEPQETVEAENNEEVDIVEERQKLAEKPKEAPQKSKMKRTE